MTVSRIRVRTVAATLILLSTLAPFSAGADTVPVKVSPTKEGSSAVPTVTAEQALATFQEYFPVAGGEGQLRASLNTYGAKPTWSIMYTIVEGNGSSSTSVGEVDAVTGRIIHAGSFNRRLGVLPTGPAPEPLAEAEARDKAWLLVQRMAPELAPTLRPAPMGFEQSLSYDQALGAYRFTWAPFRGDVPVYGGGVSVTVDKFTGAYRSFTARVPENVSYQDAKPTMDAEEALAKFQSLMQPTLVYRVMHDPEKGPSRTAGLVYRFDQSAAALDAVTGDLIDYAGRPLAPVSWEPIGGTAVAAPGEPSRPLSEAEAIQRAQELFGAPDAKDIRVHPSPPFPGDGQPRMILSWAGDESSGTVLFDPDTGRLLSGSFSRQSRNRRPESQPLTAEEQASALAVATDFLKRNYPDLVPSLKLRKGGPIEHYGNNLSFFFERHEHGIPVEGQGVRVGVDLASMHWSSLTLVWSEDITFPAPEKRISADEAARRYYRGKEATLAYRIQGPLDPRAPEGAAQEGRLVYLLAMNADDRSFQSIDGFSGDLLDLQGRTRSEVKTPDERLAGHWAEMELRYLIELKGLTRDRVNPDAAVSRDEGLSLVFAALTGDRYISFGGPEAPEVYKDVERTSPAFRTVTAAIQRGILKPVGEEPLFQGNQPVTRTEFAVWLARALGYGKLAASSLQVGTSFGDLEALPREERNAIAFLEALGILKSAPEFRGSDHLTQAEAAAMVVRTINSRRTE